ncbi:uncharacterized protein K452DRAFT_230719 [Aplosporella prunicola CBS 121167]|uniref:RNase III domain-containing protein n=1 Tax=Aplosporella prunicola CBS 121167 TaxID=1176127 RepID=A0A6A6B7Z6_9PEZI|nr:uncharacterized protein K452DRAFT_230719 [Aplosporella prunicola CBS 121167]KAF2140210.1 hypothetical protein K452DRAFT_230719 [Aplosporella prunicola CBS 121167]
MASKVPIRPFLGAAKSVAGRGVRLQLSAISAASTSSTPSNSFATDEAPRKSDPLDPAEMPRWKQTPRAMAAPIRLRPIKPDNVWRVNEDPRKLDETYVRILGKGGDKLLEEEVKWLAVTHKSFDHGRRGFNDRLAFLGRRIIELQTSLALLNTPRSGAKQHTADAYGREPYKHPALDGLDNLAGGSKEEILSRDRLAGLAKQHGLSYVIRWRPKKSDSMKGSGLNTVLAHTLYAIVGAIAMQKGGDVANQVVKERILAPLDVMMS